MELKIVSNTRYSRFQALVNELLEEGWRTHGYCQFPLEVLIDSHTSTPKIASKGQWSQAFVRTKDFSQDFLPTTSEEEKILKDYILITHQQSDFISNLELREHLENYVPFQMSLLCFKNKLREMGAKDFRTTKKRGLTGLKFKSP